MSTGIETWNQNLLDIGPMYPFVGLEGLLVIIGLASWIIWHIWQIRMENRIYDQDEKDFSDPDALRDAIRSSMAGTLIEQRKVHEKQESFSASETPGE